MNASAHVGARAAGATAVVGGFAAEGIEGFAGS